MLDYEDAQEERDQLYRDYTATMQRQMATILVGYMTHSDWEPPSYIELAHPGQAAAAPQETNESAKAHVFEIFGIKPEEIERG